MKFATTSLLTAAAVVAAAPSASGLIVFDFNNGTEFDGAGAGATMSATDGSDTVELTSVGVFAPEFEETDPDVFVLTGNTIAAVTNIGSSTNAIGINNPSIGTSDFRTFKGDTSGTESSDMNFGESWVIEFDTDVTIEEFNFSSIDGDGSYTVTVEGIGTPFEFPDGTSGDDFSDPFSGLIITAGTNITFEVNDANQNVSVRITEISVEIVPEPSSLALMGLGGLLIARRRRG